MSRHISTAESIRELSRKLASNREEVEDDIKIKMSNAEILDKPKAFKKIKGRLKMYKKIIFIFSSLLILLVFLISCSTKSSDENATETSSSSDESAQFTQVDQTIETSIKYPDPAGFVNDFAGVFTEEEKSEMENFLSGFLEDKDIAVVVVSVNSLEGLTIDKYANELFNTWGIGTETNDGILLLVALNEGMLRIEVGISMEDEITNEITKRIIDDTIIPYFRENKIGQGCYEGVKAIIAKISSSQ